ncbi:MAG: ROK family protein [Acidobacteriota bacterium]
MSKKQVVLGVDIGGTNTKFGIIDREGRCLAASSMGTESNHPPDHFFRRLQKNSDQLLGTVEEACKLAGVGIGAPNANFYKGTIEDPPNLEWDYVDIRAEMGRHLPVPVAVTNDANAAALGEMFFGAARGMKDFIVITLGTGLGSGIIANGELIYGADGFAGEIGHTTVFSDGRVCKCGRRGCLETYASATGLCRTVYELICDTMTPSELRSRSYEDLNAEMVHESALKGDPLALEAFHLTGRILGMKLADSVAHLSPEAIIFSGGLAAAGDLILDPVRQALEEQLFPIYRNKVQLVQTRLNQGNPAILGAGALIWNFIEKKPSQT